MYLLAISPDTEVCECKGEDKKSCELSRLELGDDVQVEFTGSARKAGHATEGKHGRGRTYMGKASAISILAEVSESDGKAQSPKSESSDSSKPSSGEKTPSKKPDDHSSSSKKEGDK